MSDGSPMTSNPVKEEAVTEKMLRAGMAAFGATELVGSSFTPRAIRSAYLAMRQADPRIAELKAVLEEQTLLVDRLCDAVDQAAEDIGHESIDKLLKLLGPTNERAIETLGGRAALNRKDKP